MCGGIFADDEARSGPHLQFIVGGIRQADAPVAISIRPKCTDGGEPEATTTTTTTSRVVKVNTHTRTHTRLSAYLYA